MGPDESDGALDEREAEEAANVRACNEALASMRDHGGRWWSYSVSHNVFHLVVGDALGRREFGGNVVLVFSCCEHISGPVDWPRQRLELRWYSRAYRWHNESATGTARLWRYFLRDRAHGFKLKAMYFHRWERDVDLLKRPNLY